MSRWIDGLTAEQVAALDELTRITPGPNDFGGRNHDHTVCRTLLAAFRRKPRRWEAVMGPDRIDFGASAPPPGTRLELVEILED